MIEQVDLKNFGEDTVFIYNYKDGSKSIEGTFVKSVMS